MTEEERQQKIRESKESVANEKARLADKVRQFRQEQSHLARNGEGTTPQTLEEEWRAKSDFRQRTIEKLEACLGTLKSEHVLGQEGLTV